MAKKYINCIQLEPHLWRAALTFPFDESLGYKPKTKYFWGRTAYEACRKREKYGKTFRERQKESRTLLAYVKDTFLPEQKALVDAGHLSFAYYERRRSLLYRYFITPKDKKFESSPLRQVLIIELRPSHIYEWFKIAKMLLSQEYLYRLRSDMRAILKELQDSLPERPLQLYFERMPTCSLPKRQSVPVLFEPADLEAALRNPALPIEHRAVVAFPLISLCRPSEMFALTWDDIDLEHGLYSITKSLKRIGHGTFKIGPPKTGDSGKRFAEPLGGFLTGLLRELQSHRTASQVTSPFVFLSADRHVPYTVQSFKKSWRKIKESLGLKGQQRFYDLKHWGNSYLASKGISSKLRAQRMGHTTNAMADTVYQIVTSQAKTQAVDIWDEPIAIGAAK